MTANFVAFNLHIVVTWTVTLYLQRVTYYNVFLFTVRLLLLLLLLLFFFFYLLANKWFLRTLRFTVFPVIVRTWESLSAPYLARMFDAKATLFLSETILLRDSVATETDWISVAVKIFNKYHEWWNHVRFRHRRILGFRYCQCQCHASHFQRDFLELHTICFPASSARTRRRNHPYELPYYHHSWSRCSFVDRALYNFICCIV